jgi:hypothetical protein
MYNNYNNSHNLMISIGSVVSSQQKNAQIVLREILKMRNIFIVDCPLYENIRVKGVGMIRAEIGLKNRQIINETHSFRCFLIL